jgi:hypothetical protein
MFGGSSNFDQSRARGSFFGSRFSVTPVMMMAARGNPDEIKVIKKEIAPKKPRILKPKKTDEDLKETKVKKTDDDKKVTKAKKSKKEVTAYLDPTPSIP